MNRQVPSPLPPRDGVNPSLVWLPAGSWSSISAFLHARFPHISIETWRERMAKGEVVDANGERLSPNSHYRAGMCLYYYRELPQEQSIPVQVTVLHETEHLLIVDKPHFLPVTPAGAYLQETVLVRLRKQFNNPEISPAHRLDRETAGVMLFTKNQTARGAYQQLFAQRAVQKSYHAIAPTRLDLDYPLTHRSRLVEAAQFFVMQEVAGEANSETRITLIESFGANALYQLEPVTGKKHQLRMHMASLGMPIVNDLFYPKPQPVQADDYTKPLKLLAKRIEFIDPISQQLCSYESQLTLDNVE